MAMMVLPDDAQAASNRIPCDIYATNRVDPIASTLHLHRQFGNTSTSNTSTGDSLYANKDTSCDASWWTNAGWFPVERYEPVAGTIVYYRAPGDASEVVDIPRGMELIAHKVAYSCGSSPGDAQPTQDTPPYGCTQNWSTQIQFPRCWNGVGNDSTDVVYGPNRQDCPADHPYKLMEVNFLVRHLNTDGKVPNPLQVSMGVDQWGSYKDMHADYIFAAQDEFLEDVDLNGNGKLDNVDPATYDGTYSEMNLLDLCLRKAPPTLEFNNSRCRVGGLLPAQQKALTAYYN